MQAVVCRVHSEEALQEAVQRLQEGGFAPASVEVRSGFRASWRAMVRLRKGDTLVIVRTADEHAPRAAAILNAAGAELVHVRRSASAQ